MDRSDSDLCRAAAAGDHVAFRDLVARQGPGLFRIALSLCGSRPDAEDLCQETFLAAYTGLGRFDGRSSVRTWLTAILLRRCSRLWQQRKRHRQQVPLDEGMERPARADSAGDGGRRLDLIDAIRSLPEEFRQVILLREVEGFSYEEIAQALDLPCGTVQSRIHRARLLLKEKLAAYRP